MHKRDEGKSHEIEITVSSLTAQFEELTWDHGDAAEAWHRTAQACIRRRGAAKHPEQTLLLLEQAAEALMGHVNTQKPWQPSNWKTCHKRTLAWRRAKARESAAELLGNPITGFPATGVPITPRALTGIHALPIGNTHRLAHMAMEADLRLNHLVPSCLNGSTIIYTLHRRGRNEPYALVQLDREPDTGERRLAGVIAAGTDRPSRKTLQNAHRIEKAHNRQAFLPPEEHPPSSEPGNPQDERKVRQKLFRVLIFTAIMLPLWHLFLKDLTPEPSSPLASLMKHTAAQILSLIGAIALMELICGEYAKIRNKDRDRSVEGEPG